MQSLSNSNFIFSQTRRVMLLFVFCTVVQMGWWHHTWKDSNSRWIKATLFLLSNKDCWTKANLTCNTARAETLCWICVTFTEWCFFFWYLCWKSNSERSALSFVYAARIPECLQSCLSSLTEPEKTERGLESQLRTQSPFWLIVKYYSLN